MWCTAGANAWHVLQTTAGKLCLATHSSCCIGVPHQDAAPVPALQVSLTLELTTPACPVKDMFKRQAEQFVGVSSRPAGSWPHQQPGGEAASNCPQHK
jgi:hypothetical protein